MAFKIGGSVGKAFEDTKKNIKTGLKNPGKGAADSFFDDPLVSGIVGMMPSSNKGSVAGDYLKQQQQTKEAKAAAANDPNKGFSPYMDSVNPYVQRYGNGAATNNAILSDTTEQAYSPLQQQIQGVVDQAPVSANVDPAFRQYQMQLAQQLQAQANGQGPSLAQMQLQQATDQSLNQSLGAIRAATGQNGALAARTAALAGSQQLGQMGLESGMLRLKEQRMAQDALGTLANQGRAGDIDTTGLQAKTVLEGRGQQLDALGKLGGVIGDRISGKVQTQQNALGISASAEEDKRIRKREEASRSAKREDAVGGAIINGLATAFSS